MRDERDEKAEAKVLLRTQGLLRESLTRWIGSSRRLKLTKAQTHTETRLAAMAND
jgi:hypothetical protein